MSSLDTYLKHMADKNASDLYFTTGAPPSMKVEGETHPISKKRLEPGTVKAIAYEIMDERQQRDFEERLEMNLGLTVEGVGRYRVNIYRQRGEVAMVIRYIKANIPDIKTLNLPGVLGALIGEKKGLILVVGSTGSGKSTTLASMLDHRNSVKTGHILTIEDPIEYVFEHKRSILGQREVGLDTLSYENALREAMREAPDVIMIGEVRDRRTMEAAIAYADTGHLCLSTLHAVNAYQALDRIINMFPPDAKNQILMDLSLNLRGIISQRLVPGKKGLRVPAVEIMLGGGYISELIREGEIHKIKDAMARGSKEGMQTFDQSLFELFKTNKVELNTALDFADSRSDLEWKINFGGGVGDINRSHTSEQIAAPGADFEELTFNK
ncbi:MAG: PilT/PilU family type 4a pilus ATPase [Gammaproteobacteria bacterium]|nr:PilT/PilU family type 4a pilus ATPase [Gammaproteobacteria bacterium]